MDESTTVWQAVEARKRDERVRHAIETLLRDLGDWVDVVQVNHADVLPAHRITFTTALSDGPAQAVRRAVKAEPELWLHAVPPEIVMVPRATLVSIGLSDAVIDWMERGTQNLLDREAARHTHEAPDDQN